MKLVKEIIDWILENRTGNAFKGYSENTIYNELLQCSKEGTLVILTEDNIIIGIVCGSLRPKNVMYIHDILIKKTEALKAALHILIENWPHCTLEGFAHNRIRKFNNPRKLLERL